VEAGVDLVEEWRRSAGEIYELSEVGSNRTMIDIMLRAEAYAAYAGSKEPAVSLEHLKKGTLDAMLGHIRARSGDSYAQDERTVHDFLKKQFGETLFKASLEYWCTFFAEFLKRDKSEARRIIDEGKQLAKTTAPDKGKFPKFAKFAEYSAKRERHRGRLQEWEAAVAAFRLLTEHDVFECEEKK
jgi:hypothetical protein